MAVFANGGVLARLKINHFQGFTVFDFVEKTSEASARATCEAFSFNAKTTNGSHENTSFIDRLGCTYIRCRLMKALPHVDGVCDNRRVNNASYSMGESNLVTLL